MRYIIAYLFFLSPMLLFSQDVTEGAAIFKNTCKACHSIDKKLVGPALKNVHERRDSAWIYSFIKGSQAMIQAGDSIGIALFSEFNQVPMPDQNFSDTQISSILNYIKAESAPQPIAANPISRPEVYYGTGNNPFGFDEYAFWIPFTIFVIILIFVFYYFTIMTDIGKLPKDI